MLIHQSALQGYQPLEEQVALQCQSFFWNIQQPKTTQDQHIARRSSKTKKEIPGLRYWIILIFLFYLAGVRYTSYLHPDRIMDIPGGSTDLCPSYLFRWHCRIYCCFPEGRKLRDTRTFSGVLCNSILTEPTNKTQTCSDTSIHSEPRKCLSDRRIVMGSWRSPIYSLGKKRRRVIEQGERENMLEYHSTRMTQGSLRGPAALLRALTWAERL